MRSQITANAQMTSRYCQSCGMPMARDPEGGASLADGTKSGLYCSLCMSDGVFHYTGTDVREFQRIVIAKMVENGWRPFWAWLLTRQIPRLKRWRKVT